MHRLKSLLAGKNPLIDHPGPLWSAAVCTAAEVAALAAGILFLSRITAQLGIFPTLFLGMVIAGCVGMQLAELTTPRHPQH